ncbi:ATP synthase subunit I [Pueribacillus sp. YX66]|uniref:ATP synthase subunit I n=1 Tax=Pueribacillus sp. YX66 TaxID=3229242 RepID=UPI00358CEA06
MLQKNLVRRYLSYAAYLLAFFVLGWGFTSYQDVFLGLILGTIISFINILFLSYRVKKASDAAVEGRKVRSVGMMQRFALAGLAVFIVFQFPDVFHLFSMIIGLMTGYIIIFIDSILNS